MNDGLKDKHRKAILEVLQKHPKIERVVLFGSRAMGTFTPTSDIDIALYGNLSMQDQARIAEELDELPIPYAVDLVRMKTVTSPELLAHVKEHGKEWRSGSIGMAGEWKTLPLAECMAAIIDYRGKTPTKTTFGVPLVTAKIVKGGRIEEPAEFIAEADFDAWMRRGMPKPGDIVMTTEAPLGEVAQLDDRKIALAQRVITLRGKPDLLYNTYLKFLLQSASVQEELLSRGTGTTVVGIKQSELRKVSLSFPPLAEQKAIAAVLGALDDKIELNRRMNATLEAMARALFQSWFVDFDPVRAKLDGRPPAALDPATAALFPDSFQDSEAGHIPKGWTIQPVGEVVDCVGGGTPSTAEPKYWEGGTHHWTTPKDFSSLQAPVLLDTDRKLTDAGIAKISSGLLPAGTLLLSSRAPVGYLAIAAMPVAINQGFIALKCNECASNFFMLNWCQTNMAEIESRATGTTFAEISKQNFRPIRVVLPPKELMAAFTAKVAPLYAQITANLHQSRTLATLRDTLLPKLLSGELSVAEAAPTL